MLDTGGLKSILESETIVKVMHSSKNDATALYWQFDVKLHNVFDTQLACMELQRAKGRRLPSRMKLAEVCRLYCPQKADLLEEKEDVQTHWSKNEGEFWAKRPMTQEMIDYASQDVLVLIPELTLSISREVETRGLTSQLTTQTCLDIEGTINREVKERIEEEEDAMVLEILQNFSRTTRPPDRLSDITDEDVLDAITRLRSDRLDTEGLPPNIRSLKVQSLTSKVEEIRTELDEKVNGYKSRTPHHELPSIHLVEQMALE
ncbi:hypothetical protein C0Q70_02329 [Pomacea canaliculata]|uniref:3'-5' exonuclease domain-containing protein n=1 Tax=Pomacea canaliculata TaxID=400727 RepID=A0A2T7PPL8_POMCA|nr:hypothetical protein C0Q70_02329 [Pomacea canaliculata]